MFCSYMSTITTLKQMESHMSFTDSIETYSTLSSAIQRKATIVFVEKQKMSLVVFSPSLE